MARRLLAPLVVALAALAGPERAAGVVLAPGDVVALGLSFDLVTGEVASAPTLHRLDLASGTFTTIAPLNGVDVAVEAQGTILLLENNRQNPPDPAGELGSVHRVDPATGTPSLVAGDLLGARHIDVDGAGRIFVDGTLGLVRIDPMSGAATSIYAGECGGVGVAPDGRVVTSRVAGGLLEYVAVDPEGGGASVLAQFAGLGTPPELPRVTDLDVTPNGDVYASERYVAGNLRRVVRVAATGSPDPNVASWSGPANQYGQFFFAGDAAGRLLVGCFAFGLPGAVCDKDVLQIQPNGAGGVRSFQHFDLFVGELAVAPGGSTGGCAAAEPALLAGLPVALGLRRRGRGRRRRGRPGNGLGQAFSETERTFSARGPRAPSDTTYSTVSPSDRRS